MSGFFTVRRPLLGIVLMFLAGCQSAQQTEDRLVAAFGEAMFGGGVGPQDVSGSTGKLVKWQNRVQVSIIEWPTDANVARTKALLAEFGELTGLDLITLAPADRSARLRIYFERKRDFIINTNELAACYTRVRTDESGVILEAEIHVGENKDGEWRLDCMAHEMLHAFGWSGHTHRISSAISYMHGKTELTQWDRVLMRALYDPRLVPGTSKDDGLPVARNIIDELMRQ